MVPASPEADTPPEQPVSKASIRIQQMVVRRMVKPPG
jgi:hypothetical protein